MPAGLGIEQRLPNLLPTSLALSGAIEIPGAHQADAEKRWSELV